MKRSKKDLLKNILWRVEDIDRAILVDDPEEGEIYNDIGGISLENNRELRAINEKLDKLIQILSKPREPVGAEFDIPSEQTKTRMLIRKYKTGEMTAQELLNEVRKIRKEKKDD